MIYLRQPITGLLTLTSQPISGRDNSLLYFIWAGRNTIQL